MFGARMLGFSLANPAVQLGFAFAPAMAAFIVRRWVTREGFADAGLALRLRTSWPYYLMAWIGPLVLVAVTAGLAALTGAWKPSLAPLEAHAAGLPIWACVVLLMLVLPILTPLYWGEEFGWTSYLRLRLFPDRPVLSTLATGLIWAVWHYPLAFLGYIDFSNTALGLLAWTGSFLCQETALTWIRLRSGTVWAVSLAHAGNNMVLSLLAGGMLSAYAHMGTTASTVYTGAAIGLACAALALLPRTPNPRKPSRPT